MSDKPKDQRFTNKQEPALVEQYNRISKAIGRLTRDEAWDQLICAGCRRPVDESNGVSAFRDEQSRREYWITAECQACQDITWSALKAMEDPDSTALGVPRLVIDGLSDLHGDLFYTLTDFPPEPRVDFFEQVIREGEAEFHIPVTCDSCHTTFTAVCKGLSGSFHCPSCNVEIQYELNQ